MTSADVFVVGAARTPIGAFGGGLSTVPAVTLGQQALGAALKRAGVSPESVELALMGQVLTAGVGQAPARQAAKAAGIPDRAGAVTVGKVCGSGLQSILFGAQYIRLGDAALVAAGGMESMSQAPYLLPGARTGYRMGHQEAVDSMIHDGLWDPYNTFHMGRAAELCARELSFSREAQDDLAESSYRRAQGAQERGAFAAEIAPVEVVLKKETKLVDVDEEPGRARFEKMRTLKPAFEQAGTITAANASKINDGAAALILASEATVKREGLKPLARIVGWGAHAQEPEWFTTAPVGAMENALKRTGLSLADIDLYEVNEAFAVVPMACAKKLDVDLEKTNVRGGAIALGHPIGASGARIVVTLLHAMQEQKAKRGMASICIGGGEGLAMIFEAC